MKNKEQKGAARSACAKGMVKGILLAGCLSFGLAAHAAVNFQFQYIDQPGTGFLDSVDGASRQAALNTAASTFSSMFGRHFSNSGTIVLEASATDDPYATTLAAAGSQLVDPGMAGFNLGEVVRTKLQTGVDLNGNDVDGSLDVNFGNAWELNFDAPTSNAKYDFYSTMFHEFTHTLGFASFVEQSGDPFFGMPAAGSWNTFDRLIVDKSGISIINPANFALNQAVWDAGSVGGASPAEGLFFNGSNAVAANGGSPVGLYTPEIWEEGSSVSHLDDENPSLAGMMMLAASDTGPYARDYSAIEVGILEDLGYAAVVPEPEIYAMMLAGLGLFGWFSRRRQG